jgi:general secretion pathway protein J
MQTTTRPTSFALALPPPRYRVPRKARNQRGFTLIELLVALSAMALLALMSFNGVQSLSFTQHHVQARSDEWARVQVALAQWQADLEALSPTPTQTGLDWDGRVVRLLRRSRAGLPDEGLRVVAWAQRTVAPPPPGNNEAARATPGGSQWLRWQSGPLRTRGELDAAWAQALQWGRSPADADRMNEVAVMPMSEWQIFYFRANAWTNPLSSNGEATPSDALPDGVRVVLHLPPGHSLAGKITRDWVRPTLGGGKS